MKQKLKFYSLEDIKKIGAHYNVIFGQRSNGKTYAVLCEILDNYRNKKKQGALIRRYLDEIGPTKRSTIFAKIVENGEIAKRWKNTPEQWTSVRYWRHRFYLCKTVDTGKENPQTICDENPRMYVFALTEEQDIKETCYPEVTTIFFDEFISRNGYLMNEFTIFLNICSTIIREREDGVTIYRVGNTISKYCPYFKERGLSKITDIPLGKIQVYSYGESRLKVAVQRSDNVKKINSRKDINPYFAFDNPHLNRITQGEWELDIYPHCPARFVPKDIIYRYFIRWEENTFECDIVNYEGDYFTYVHVKTTPIKDIKEEIVFQKEASIGNRYRQRLTKPTDVLGKKILLFYLTNHVFYQDNTVGDCVNNYLKWCNTIRTA